MGKVLAHALPAAQGLFNRRIDFGAVGHVGKQFVDRFVEFRQQCQRIVRRRSHLSSLASFSSRGAGLREVAGQEHLPVVVARDQRFQIGPVAGSRRLAEAVRVARPPLTVP